MLCTSRIVRSVLSRGYNSSVLRNLNTEVFKTTNNGSLQSITPLLSKLSLTNHSNSWIWQHNDKMKLPVLNRLEIDLPSIQSYIIPLIEPQVNSLPLEAPTNVDTDNVKEAVTMIIVRRKKMKKHKLRKLRKRMKAEWAKLRQKRELKKEKSFQAVLIQQCKDGEAFSAEKYVEDQIGKLNEVIIPKYWKGKRLPEFIIREKMGLPPISKKKSD